MVDLKIEITQEMLENLSLYMAGRVVRNIHGHPEQATVSGIVFEIINEFLNTTKVRRTIESEAHRRYLEDLFADE